MVYLAPYSQTSRPDRGQPISRIALPVGPVGQSGKCDDISGPLWASLQREPHRASRTFSLFAVGHAIPSSKTAPAAHRTAGAAIMRPIDHTAGREKVQPGRHIF